MNENVKNFIDAVNSQNFADAKSEFQAVMANKVNDAFETKKIEIAQSMADGSELQATNEETEVLDEKMSRQLKDPKKETMVVKDGKVEVIDKKDVDKYMKKGYELAEAKHSHDFSLDFDAFDAKLSRGDTVSLKGLESDGVDTSNYKKYMEKALGRAVKNLKIKVDRTGMANVSFEVVDPNKVKSVLQDEGIMD